MAEETLDIAHDAIDALVHLSVNGIVGNLINLGVEGMIYCLTTRDRNTRLDIAQHVVEDTIGGAINGGIGGEITGPLAEVLQEIWI